jgi:hypothetical protein
MVKKIALFKIDLHCSISKLRIKLSIHAIKLRTPRLNYVKRDRIKS